MDGKQWRRWWRARPRQPEAELASADDMPADFAAMLAGNDWGARNVWRALGDMQHRQHLVWRRAFQAGVVVGAALGVAAATLVGWLF